MRICPKCNKLELDVQPDMHLDSEEAYFFRCWNCGFKCSKEEGQKYPSEAIELNMEAMDEILKDKER